MRKRLTFSGLNRARHCRGPFVYPAHERRWGDATRGRVIHKFLENVGNGMDPGDALMLIEDEDTRALCAQIPLKDLPVAPGQFDHELKFAFHPVTREVKILSATGERDYDEVPEEWVCGTVDVVGRRPGLVYVPDFKTGAAWFVPKARDNLSLQGYAMCGAKVAGVDQAVVELIHIWEDGTPHRDRHDMDVMDLDVVEQHIMQIAGQVQADRKMLDRGEVVPVTPGDHCWRCPAYQCCPDKVELMLQLAHTPAKVEQEFAALLTKDNAPAAYLRWRAIHDLVHNLDGVFETWVRENGDIDLGNGRVYGERSVVGRPKYAGAKVYQYLRAAHGQAFADDACDHATSGEAIKRAMGHLYAAEGLKGHTKAGEALIADLEAKGMVERKPTKRIDEHAAGQSSPQSTKLISSAAEVQSGSATASDGSGASSGS